MTLIYFFYTCCMECEPRKDALHFVSFILQWWSTNTYLFNVVFLRASFSVYLQAVAMFPFSSTHLLQGIYRQVPARVGRRLV